MKTMGNIHKVRDKDGNAIVRIQEVRQVRIGLSRVALNTLRYESNDDIVLPQVVVDMVQEGGYQIVLASYNPDDDVEENKDEEDEDE